MQSSKKVFNSTAIFIFTLLLTGYSPISIAGNPATKPIKPTIAKPGTISPSDVIIIGDVDCSDGHQSASCGFGDNSGWTNPGNNGGGGAPGDNGGGGGGDAPTELASNGDTRCAATSTGIKNTTSLSDETDRYLAAVAVFRTMTLTGKIQANKAGYLKITFADGGTENWFVTEPMFSDGGMVKQPGSLVKGDGIPRPKTCTA